MRIQLSALSVIFFLSFAALAGPTLPADALRVPLVTQSSDHHCGPAALLSVFYYWGDREILEDEIGQAAGTTKDGTDSSGLISVAKSRGFSVEEKTDLTLDELRAHLSKWTPVILDLQAWVEGEAVGSSWKDQEAFGHYVVLIALDSEYAYFMDPSLPLRYGFMSIPELLERWHDGGAEHYGIVVRGKKPFPQNAVVEKID